MDITDIRLEKGKLEKELLIAIQNKCKEFTEKTGIMVKSINVGTYHFGGTGQSSDVLVIDRVYVSLDI